MKEIEKEKGKLNDWFLENKKEKEGKREKRDSKNRSMDLVM